MNQNPSVAQIPPTNSDRLLTKKAAAKRLSISIRTLDRLIKEGLLEKIFVGASPRIRESDIQEIILRGA